MAASKNEPSFDEIIQTSSRQLPSKCCKLLTLIARQRKKNEALANEIFGKGRRASTPAVGGRFIPGTGRSLASRVGITKVLSLQRLQEERSICAMLKLSSRRQSVLLRLPLSYKEFLHSNNRSIHSQLVVLDYLGSPRSHDFLRISCLTMPLQLARRPTP